MTCAHDKFITLFFLLIMTLLENLKIRYNYFYTVFFACALDMSNRETFLSLRITLCLGNKPQSIARLIS